MFYRNAPCRNRTYNLMIKRQFRCRASGHRRPCFARYSGCSGTLQRTELPRNVTRTRDLLLVWRWAA